MARMSVVAAMLWLVAASALAGEGGPEDFFRTRDRLIAVHGNASAASIASMYERITQTHERTPTPSLLHERVVLAGLAGLHGVEDMLLMEIVEKGDAGARLVGFVIEETRSHGALMEYVGPLAAAVKRLDGAQRREAVRALAGSFLWTRPPAEVEALVRSELSGADVAQAAWLARALASWGYRDDAGKTLVDRALRKDCDVEARTALAGALEGIGLRQEARRVAGETFGVLEPEANRPGLTFGETIAEREDGLGPYVELAKAAGAVDLLVDRMRPKEGRAADWQVVDYGYVLREAGLLAERAEAWGVLVREKPSPGFSGMQGAALLAAGDAWSAEQLLTAATLTGEAEEDAFLDLIDAIFALRDSAALCPAAVLYSMTEASPTAPRMMSELLRRTGDVAASDELFNKFVSLSDLGADSRFNWEGSKLLAQYYLDTGRLEMGRAMAITALRQVVDGQAGKQMTRSRHPDTYVALFERFDGVETMLDYLRERRKDFPDSIFLSLMEEAALVSLGRAQEAVEASQRAHPRESAVGRKVLLGELYAKMGRFEEAAGHYEMAIAADAQAPQAAYLTLAGLYARLGRMQDAERLLSDAAERFGLSMWFSAGGFFAGQGDAVRASRAYRMLDDLGARVDAKAFGEAARFLAANGEAEPMADMLARRLTVQESFEAKAEYVVECMPWESAAAPKYMIVGERLAEGRLSYDHALSAFFYRALSERSAMLLDAATAVSAASKAVEHEGDNPQSLANLVAVTAGRPSEAAARAALAAHAKVPSAAALLALAEAELALGRAESGCGRLAAAFGAPLTSGETARALRLTKRHGLERPLLGKLPFGPAPGRPWQMHALLAEAAATGASEATAASESTLATKGGDYVGRALWAAELYLNAGAGDRAREVMDARKACGEHPAVALFDVEAARRAGDTTAALDAATAACRTYSRPPAQAVFAAEVARLKAGE